MEDVLDLYEEEYDPRYPTVCLDEKPVVLHYTPKHGSWLNMAEIEIAIFERNALARRLEDEAALHRQVLALETERNQQRRGICWQFTAGDARMKLEKLYPIKPPASN